MSEWWYDLKQNRAVSDDERGPAKDLLGPYPSKEAAENWRQTHEGREAVWNQDDEDGDEEGDDSQPA